MTFQIVLGQQQVDFIVTLWIVSTIYHVISDLIYMLRGR